MSRQGIAISAGSACSSGQQIPSRILLAMGYSEAEALGSIRLSLGRATTQAAVEQVAQSLRAVLLSVSEPAPQPLPELAARLR